MTYHPAAAAPPSSTGPGITENWQCCEACERRLTLMTGSENTSDRYRGKHGSRKESRQAVNTGGEPYRAVQRQRQRQWRYGTLFSLRLRAFWPSFALLLPYGSPVWRTSIISFGRSSAIWKEACQPEFHGSIWTLPAVVTSRPTTPFLRPSPMENTSTRPRWRHPALSLFLLRASRVESRFAELYHQRQHIRLAC